MPAVLFFSYSHEDEAQRDRLEKHLALLQREGLIETWHDRRILPGDDFARQIDEGINRADIILLLVSASFIASEYCYSIEMTRAMERHREGAAVVVPVILRPCLWTPAPFGMLQGVPKDAKPISQWADVDEGYTNVAVQLRALLKSRAEGWGHHRPGVGHPSVGHRPVSPDINAADAAKALAGSALQDVPSGAHITLPRSSNLRLRKEFSQLERDQFLRESFDHMAQFFEGSLQELQARHPEVQARFEQIDRHRFTAAVYRHGKVLSECSIRFGDNLGRGISYSNGLFSGGAISEQLRVEADDQSLFLSPMMSGFSGARDRHLTQNGAAELFWEILLRPLQ